MCVCDLKFNWFLNSSVFTTNNSLATKLKNLDGLDLNSSTYTLNNSRDTKLKIK